ncbi:MAG: hypothetical protein IJJ06_12270 [Mogibacterium sp.]|nr:hypothetical protein [Mogibacterium sp.]
MKINSSTFPDAGLRSCMLDMYPDGEILQSELNSRTSLDISGKGIKDLTGVWLFENLQELDCSKNSITELSINTCNALKKLKSFDISNNTSLKSLTITGYYNEDIIIEGEARPGVIMYNQVLEELNASGCTSLTQLDCSSNMLKALDLDGCEALSELNCGFNNLKELDVKDCNKLISLECSNNCLENLDVGGMPSLIVLDCSNNNLTSLDLEGKTMLEIRCSNNRLSSLDLSNVRFTDTDNELVRNANLAKIFDSCGVVYCSDNLLTTLKLPENEKISVLNCLGNELTELDLSKVVFISYYNYYSDLIYDKDKVKKLSLPEYSIGELSDQVYKGKPVDYNVLSMNIKMGGYELNEYDKESGFKCKYKNNNSIGLASVTIKDFNGISGTQTFRIVPGRATIKSVKPAKRRMTVTIKKQPGGVKYQISVKKKGSRAAAKKYTVKNGTSRTIKRLKKNSKYIVRVRAFKKVKGKTYLGKWSKAKTVKVR